LSDHRRSAPHVARNAGPIAEMLREVLPARGLVLEIASGTGEHVLHFARAFPDLAWQPSDPDPAAVRSIEAWREEAGPPNLLPAIALDARAADWPVATADAILCINMIHISPWAATAGLMRGAGALLASGAPLYLYGAYRQRGVATAPSNEAFDASLKARDPDWGLRDLEDVIAEAERNGLRPEAVIPMPANNLSVVFRRACPRQLPSFQRKLESHFPCLRRSREKRDSSFRWNDEKKLPRLFGANCPPIVALDRHHAIALDPALEGAAGAADMGDEVDVGAVEAALLDRRGAGGAEQLLVFLLQDERIGAAVDRQSPIAGGAGRDCPQIDDRVADPLALVPAPVAHVVIVAEHARPGAHLGEDSRPEAQVDLGEEIKGEDVGLGKRGREQILPAENDLAGEAGGAGILVRFADPGRIDVDAEPARAAASRRGDQNPAVARAEIDEVVAGADPGEAQHRIDHLHVARDIGDIEPGLASDEFRGVEAVRGDRRGRRAGDVVDEEIESERRERQPDAGRPQSEERT